MRNSRVEVWGRQQNERHDQQRREQPAGDSAISRPFEVLAIHGVEFEHFRRYLASTQNLPANWALPPACSLREQAVLPAWRGGELSFLRVPRESGAKPELSRNCERGVPVRQTPLRRKASGRRAGAAIHKPGDLNAHTGDPSARNGTEASWRSAFSGAFGVVDRLEETTCAIASSGPARHWLSSSPLVAVHRRTHPRARPIRASTPAPPTTPMSSSSISRAPLCRGAWDSPATPSTARA